MEYLAGRQSGIYLPTALPQHPSNKKEVTTSNLASATELLDTYNKAFWAEKGRQHASSSQYREPVTTNNIACGRIVIILITLKAATTIMVAVIDVLWETC